jgi:molybdopterin-guanine dinucleotide biosynthesis protein A
VEPFGALILAGGKGRRLGGVHKPGLLVDGVSLLDRVLAAVVGAAPVVVVGPPQPVPPSAVLVREEPPGGGPGAALATGLPHFYADPGTTARWLAVLAGDLPFLRPATLDLLRGVASEKSTTSSAVPDGAVLIDGDGRDQYLAGVYRVDALRAALATVPDPAGVALRRVVGGLDLRRVAPPLEPGAAPPWFDCDDAEDVRLAESFARRDRAAAGQPPAEEAQG